jgi:hypothetical protein
LSREDSKIDYEVTHSKPLKEIIINVTKEHPEIKKNYEIIKIINILGIISFHRTPKNIHKSLKTASS